MTNPARFGTLALLFALAAALVWGILAWPQTEMIEVEPTYRRPRVGIFLFNDRYLAARDDYIPGPRLPACDPRESLRDLVEDGCLWTGAAE